MNGPLWINIHYISISTIYQYKKILISRIRESHLRVHYLVSVMRNRARLWKWIISWELKQFSKYDNFKVQHSWEHQGKLFLSFVGFLRGISIFDWKLINRSSMKYLLRNFFNSWTPTDFAKGSYLMPEKRCNSKN